MTNDLLDESENFFTIVVVKIEMSAKCYLDDVFEKYMHCFEYQNKNASNVVPNGKNHQFGNWSLV